MGARVLVTAGRGTAERLIAALSERGLEPVRLPLVATEWVGAGALDARGATWVFTSKTAVEAALRANARPDGEVAAVGPATRASLERAGVVVTISASGTALDLLPLLPDGPVLYPRAERVDSGLIESLGPRVRAPVVYRTVCPSTAAELAAALPVDLITLASGSAARHLHALGAPELPVVVIGPSTEAAARALGLKVAAVAAVHTAEGLAQACAELAQAQLTRTRPG